MICTIFSYYTILWKKNPNNQLHCLISNPLIEQTLDKLAITCLNPNPGKFPNFWLDLVSLTNLLCLLYLTCIFFRCHYSHVFGNLDQHHDLNINISMQHTWTFQVCKKLCLFTLKTLPKGRIFLHGRYRYVFWEVPHLHFFPRPPKHHWMILMGTTGPFWTPSIPLEADNPGIRKALPSPCFGRQNLTHKHPWPCP